MIASFTFRVNFMKSSYPSGFAPIVRGLLFAAVCFGMSGMSPAEDFLNGQLTVTPLPPPTTRTSSSSREGTTHGYMEYRFLINNKSSQRHQVTLSFGRDRGFGGEVSLTHASTSVLVEPKSEATATILQPPVSLTYGYAPLEVRIDNRRPDSMSLSATPHGWQNRSYGYGSRSYGYSSPSGGAVGNILVSNKITANQRELLTRGTLEEEKPPENATSSGGMMGGMPGGMTGPGMGGAPLSMSPAMMHAVWQSEVPTDQWSDQ